MGRKDYHFEIGETINSLTLNNQSHIKSHIGDRVVQYKAYDYVCEKCGDSDTVREYDLKRGRGCPCCANRKVVENINSIVAKEETKWMIDYFQGGYEEAKLYTPQSNQKLFFICPSCKRKRSHTTHIYHLFNSGGFKCSCQGGGSYGERFVENLLMESNICFETQYSPSWSQGKKYDFYIPSLNTIVETHGIQHYQEMGWNRSLKEEHENDLLKFDLSVINGIEHYIIIDCRRSEHGYIKRSIVDSGLLQILQVHENTPNWAKCGILSETGMVKEVCDRKKDNPNLTIKDLSTIFNITTTCVRNYLVRGQKHGWCDFNPKQEAILSRKQAYEKYGSPRSKQVLMYKDNVLLGEFDSAMDLSRKSKELFNVTLSNSKISAVCRGERKTHKGYTFKYRGGE